MSRSVDQYRKDIIKAVESYGGIALLPNYIDRVNEIDDMIMDSMDMPSEIDLEIVAQRNALMREVVMFSRKDYGVKRNYRNGRK